MQRLRLRYPAVCCGCASKLGRGTDAWWDVHTKTVACLACGRTLDIPHSFAGHAGASARTMFESLRGRREQRIKDALGKRLGGLVLALSDEPQSIRAWEAGAVGEERLAKTFENRLPESATTLHDRRIPGSRANIDHIVVAPSGVWIVDAKSYAGKIELRRVGTVGRRQAALFVGGRNRTDVVDGMRRQVDAVRSVISAESLTAGVEIASAVCFVGADWGIFTKPFDVSGVLIARPRKLAERIAADGPLTPADVTRLAGRIAVTLPPAARAPAGAAANAG